MNEKIAYDRHKDAFLKQFLAGSFYMLPKDSVRLFGASKAVFLAYLFDLAKYADYNNQSDFFATRDKISADLGFGDRIIGDYFAFFKEHGIIESYRKGTDPRKWYKINANKIFDFALKNDFFSRCAPADSADTSNGKNCRCAPADSACAIYNNKESIKTDSIITNSAERILSKKIDSNLTFDYLAYAKEKFENASDKPKVSLDLWLEFIKSKKLVLKKYRRKAITAKMIDLNFAELYKLSEIGVNLNERLNKAIADEWQGIWFASDSKEWQKRGGHFRNNVGHLDYDQSKNVDNPLRAIETHITI